MAIQVQRIKDVTTTSTIPSGSKLLLTPDDGQYARATVTNIVGSAMDTTNDFKINETTNKVELKEKKFRGTTAEWEALTDVQKAEYTYAEITDDSSGSGGGGGALFIDEDGYICVDYTNIPHDDTPTLPA